MPLKGVMWTYEGRQPDDTLGNNSVLDLETFDFESALPVTCTELYPSEEAAQLALDYHMKYHDRVRTFRVIPIDICHETAFEVSEREDRIKIEHILKMYYTHDIAHHICTLLRRQCQGCITDAVSYRVHTCRISPRERVSRFYDLAWLQVAHKQLVEQWMDNCMTKELYPSVSQIYYWKFAPGAGAFRKRWTNRQFHLDMQLMVENYMAISETPVVMSHAIPDAPNPSKDDI
jgi:hypothetical protein